MAILESLLVALDKRRPRSADAFRKNPYLEGNFAPVGYEADTPSLDVIAGAIPQTLRGTLYRMSPAPRFPPVHRGLYHWFDGDGMIDAFFIDGGRVHHKNRWVRTEKLQIEERAGRALFGGLRDLAELAEAEGIGAAALEDIRQGRKLIDIELRQALGHGAPPELNPAFAIGRDAHLLGALFAVPARYCPDPANSYSSWLARQERRRVID